MSVVFRHVVCEVRVGVLMKAATAPPSNPDLVYMLSRPTERADANAGAIPQPRKGFRSNWRAGCGPRMQIATVTGRAERFKEGILAFISERTVRSRHATSDTPRNIQKRVRGHGMSGYVMNNVKRERSSLVMLCSANEAGRVLSVQQTG